MANGLNRVQLLGQLGADPDLRMTQGGQAILKMRVACTESYIDRNNTRKERTEWVSCTLFGRRAEALAKILHKGDRVFVEGGLHTSSYEKNGEKRYSTEVNVSNVILCGGKRGGGDAEPTASRSRAPDRRNAQPAAQATDADFGDFGGADDEIPF